MIIKTGTNNRTTRDCKSHQIKCIQVNLKHSTAATANLMKIVKEEQIDIICIQEPHTYQNKVAGIPKSYKIYSTKERKCRAAVVATSNKIDITLIRQLTDADTVVVEILKGSLKIILVNMYFDGICAIETDLAKIDAILRQGKGTGVLIATDSNARSTLWHDTLTNKRGKILEEFLASSHLHVVNEASNITTFGNHMGTSNTDLAIISSQLLGSIRLEDQRPRKHVRPQYY